MMAAVSSGDGIRPADGTGNGMRLKTKPAAPPAPVATA